MELQIHPPIAGYYKLPSHPDDPGIIFGITRRPSWWHRLWTRVLLGWEWVDE